MAVTGLALAHPRWHGIASQKLSAHLFTALFLALWEAASLVTPSYLIPGPVQVTLRLWLFITSWRDLGHLGASLFHVAAAIAISFAIGSLLALIAYYAPLFRFAIERRVGPFLNSFSAIGWTLLSIMWFGAKTSGAEPNRAISIASSSKWRKASRAGASPSLRW